MRVITVLFLSLSVLLFAGTAALRAADAAHDSDEEDNPDSEVSALGHVLDSNEIHLFSAKGLPHHIRLPNIFGFQITKFMVLELIAALIIIAVYVPLARGTLKDGGPPRGPWGNACEVLLTFVRDQIAKPSIAHHADRYVPFLWTLFLFILLNNLLGMIPFCGSATANIYVNLGLALVVFYFIHGSATQEMGFVGYLKSLWPYIDLPLIPLGIFIIPLVFVIEVTGSIVRNIVLAVRLFANLFSGHMVLATIMLFIRMAAHTGVELWAGISLTSVAGSLALSLLEIFVAFLQAYIFTFLTALFMGIALHPQH